jgi:hypothetical protein
MVKPRLVFGTVPLFVSREERNLCLLEAAFFKKIFDQNAVRTPCFLGYEVAYMVEALRYKTEGLRFDS